MLVSHVPGRFPGSRSHVASSQLACDGESSRPPTLAGELPDASNGETLADCFRSRKGSERPVAADMSVARRVHFTPVRSLTFGAIAVGVLEAVVSR